VSESVYQSSRVGLIISMFDQCARLGAPASARGRTQKRYSIETGGTGLGMSLPTASNNAEFFGRTANVGAICSGC